MIIGLSTRKHFFDSQEKIYVNNSYINLLSKYNITPVLLLNENFEELKNICDGFMILGGYDINPKLYFEDNENCKFINDDIDLLDIKILSLCEKNKKPCLGICRGIQIINVYFKGTLNQNIEECHYNSKRSLLKIKNKKYIINSYHHQGIKKLGNDLLVLGRSDNVIEYIKHKTLPIIGVQWHIEKDNLIINKIVFEEFIELIKNYL